MLTTQPGTTISTRPASTPEHTVTAAPISVARSLAPLVVDVGVPFAAYYMARDGFGADIITAFAAASVVPIVRTITSVVRTRTVNPLALLVLLVNIAGIGLSFVSGSPRVLFATSSGGSSVAAIGILVSVWLGRSVMTAGLRPFATKGDAAREAAWERLSVESTEFHRLEQRFGLVWGFALLGDCVARAVCAFTVSVSTLSWLSNVVIIGAIVAAIVVGGGVAADPMEKLVDAEVARAGSEQA